MYLTRLLTRKQGSHFRLSYVKSCSNSSGSATKSEAGKASDSQKELIMEGKFWKQLQRIRRVSIASCITGMFVTPIGLITYAGHIAPMGQVAVVGITVLACGGSTVALQLMGHPYIAKLYTESNMDGSTTYVADRTNMLGQLVPTTFQLSDVTKCTPSQHPFATFKAQGRFYYMNQSDFKDDKHVHLFESKIL